MKRLFMLRLASVLAVLVALLAVTAAAASPPQTLEGTLQGFLPDPNDQPLAVPVGSSSNLRLSETVGVHYSGNILGDGIIHRKGMVFSNYELVIEGTLTCDPCAVRDPATGDLRTGGLAIRQVTKGYIDFSVVPPVIKLESHETILGGTGELAGLRGQGTSWMNVPFLPGFPIPGVGGYSLDAHFDP